ncbi:hypothetical protein C8F04DRAFT_1273761 [Mycena alexandri]|uniref:Uncharacterized protein n=1 Tax=Mycena alexandri TaxID=1745969 RepID=A0AAD6S5S1_9AGAR|nr:hypothetical protein C8F04DRAFT_1273761 [Mycena alexandri]
MPKRLLPPSSTPETPVKRVRAETQGELSGALSPMSDMSEGTEASEPSTAVDTPSTDEAADIISPVVQISRDDSMALPSGQPSTNTGAPTDGDDALKIAALAILERLGMKSDGLKLLDLPALNTIIASVASAGLGNRGSETAEAATIAVEQQAELHVADEESVMAAGTVGAVAVVATERSRLMADLTHIGVDTARVEKWDTPELKRLLVILNWADPSHSTYSITQAPNNKDWGVPRPFNDPSNILCSAGTSTPLDLWICGEITTHWWVDAEGYPAARPAISVQPLVEDLPNFCKTLLNELCMPANSSLVADQFGPSQVKASRWMNTRAGKDQPAKTAEFKAVYDARKILRDKSLLQQINIGQLKAHDFVVLEVRIGRYAVKQENVKDIKGKKRAMDRWQAFFELQAVYKLKDAVGAAVSSYLMPREPEGAELVDWLHDNIRLSIPAIRLLASSKSDPWRLSIKRIRRFLTQKRANAALILPSTGENRASVLANVRMIHLEDINSASALAAIAGFLNNGEPELLGLLYEANRNTISWYYEVYADQEPSQPYNHVATEIFKKDVRGGIVLVKNGPVASTFELWNPLTWAAWEYALWFLSNTTVGPGTRRVMATFDSKQLFRAALLSKNLYDKVVNYLEEPEDAEGDNSSTASTSSLASCGEEVTLSSDDDGAKEFNWDGYEAVVNMVHNGEERPACGPAVEDLPPEVSLQILASLTFAERLSFARASPVVALHVAQAIQDETVSLLKAFGLRPRSVRLMQVATGTLISGSFVPAMMTGNFEPKDIDFYMPRAAGGDVALFFKKSGDWSQIGMSPTYNFASGIGRVYTMRHRRTEKKINIIELLTLNALDAVVQFHSTCVMGAISADTFWHGYPDTTLAGVTITSVARMPLTKDVAQQTQTWKILRKYAARGFDFHLEEYRAPHVCCEDLRCPATVRTSNDVGCSTFRVGLCMARVVPVGSSLGQGLLGFLLRQPPQFRTGGP